jgi:beta-xylosidase
MKPIPNLESGMLKMVTLWQRCRLATRRLFKGFKPVWTNVSGVGLHRALRPGLLAGLLVLAGCQSTQAPEQGSAQTPTPTPSPSPASPSPRKTAAGFHNPVFDGNFADPMIIERADGGFLAIATNGGGSNVQTLTSTDLINWEQGPDALPRLPSWSSEGKVWAPEIEKRADGRYLLYYTTKGPDPEVQCISVALGSQPQGPFVDHSSKPLVCETSQGGSIDSDPFTAADGSRYLYWKNDGNAIGVDTYISGQRLDSSGTKLTGKPKRLFKQTLPWEGSLVEAPFAWEHGGKIHVFYSANAYDSDAYAVGHAIADDPLGPFKKTGDPVLVSNDAAAGPGHCALFEKDGKVWMVYHAWPPDSIGAEFPGRTMWLSEVTFGPDGSVEVTPPSADYPTRP